MTNQQDLKDIKDLLTEIRDSLNTIEFHIEQGDGAKVQKKEYRRTMLRNGQ
jgi:hypothetical protein